jgi:hypothetical protein
MPGDHHPGTAVLLEPAHRTQPRLQPAVVALEPVVNVLLGAVAGRRQQLVHHRRVHRRVIGNDLYRGDLRRADGLLEEPAGGCRIPPRGDEDVDDLPELVDRAVDLAPPAGDLHVGLVREPALTDGVPAGPGGFGQQGREPLHPTVDGDVIDLDTPLGEQLLDVPVGKAEA